MGNRLSKIYTRTGDKGTTGLGDGARVDKDSFRVEAYGTVDELNSAVGWVLATDLPDEVGKCLTRVQHELFDLGGELSIPGYVAVTDDHLIGRASAVAVSSPSTKLPLPARPGPLAGSESSGSTSSRKARTPAKSPPSSTW